MSSDPKIPYVNETQKLQEVQLEALEYLGKAIERLDKRIDDLEARFVSLEREVNKE